MRERHDVRLADLTTLRIGGSAERLIEAESRADLIDSVIEGGDEALVIGGGSNVLIADAGVRQPVVAVRTTGVEVTRNGETVAVRAAAGESWDALVERCVNEGWAGIEALSGIPGAVGATPIQNVGAYGQEVSDVITAVEVLDRTTAQVHSLSPHDCDFAYRSSRFKNSPGRFVVLEVELTLTGGGRAQPVRYAELSNRLGITVDESVPVRAVREVVLELRRSKGMVLDAADHDTWSAGSFFTNPILAAPEVPRDAPAWPQADGRVKTSAAWLIEHAGFSKGYGDALGSGRATLSYKHTLAVTNRGGATSEDVLLLARTVRQGVIDRFGVELQPEPTLVGLSL
jgi:UDP-N-acetylmuramate dehydrogenase